jgi:hypothetical protein
VGSDEEVDETGYSDVKRNFVSVSDNGDDNEEKKWDFLWKIVGWINHGAFWRYSGYNRE